MNGQRRNASVEVFNCCHHHRRLQFEHLETVSPPQMCDHHHTFIQPQAMYKLSQTIMYNTPLQTH